MSIRDRCKKDKDFHAAGDKIWEAYEAPDRRSFGTRLIETLGKQLKGDVLLSYEPGGFVYALDVPLTSLTSKAFG